jgi:hypothetical protein
MSTVVIEVRYRTVAITLNPQTVWIRWTISEEMKCAMATATQAGADAERKFAHSDKLVLPMITAPPARNFAATGHAALD